MSDKKDAQRVSKIRKTITRKFNLGNYENIDVMVDQEHTVEWGSLDELMDKSSGITKLLTKDFKQTCSKVQEELEAHEKKAFMGNYGAPKDEKGVLSGGLEEDDFDSL